jgi:hypothetical protein
LPDLSPDPDNDNEELKEGDHILYTVVAVTSSLLVSRNGGSVVRKLGAQVNWKSGEVVPRKRRSIE